MFIPRPFSSFSIVGNFCCVFVSFLTLRLHGTRQETFRTGPGTDRLLFTCNRLEAIQVFTRDRSGTGPEQILYWKTTAPVLDLFWTVPELSRVNKKPSDPIFGPDPFGTGPL